MMRVYTSTCKKPTDAMPDVFQHSLVAYWPHIHSLSKSMLCPISMCTSGGLMRLAFAGHHCVRGDSQIESCVMDESYATEASPLGVLLVCSMDFGHRTSLFCEP